MKWAPWIIVIYMIAALVWWTYLLYTKNEIIYQQQQAIFALTEPPSPSYVQEVKTTYERQKNMVIGEGLVFTLALICGIFYLWIGYRKNIQNAERQKNFLLSVTHELKTPIASIKLAFETIKKRVLKPEQYQKISENGVKEIDRLNEQVENILVATSIEQRYYVQLEETDLQDLVSKIRQTRMYAPQEERVEYSVVEDEAPPSFSVDINGIMKIADNLISNALKYSGDNVDVRMKADEDKLTIEVRDLGPGISITEKKQIFKRFYRIGSEETRSSKGTGLGLYIVKHIATKNNGIVEVVDNSPTGSIFRVQIEIK